MIRYTVFVVVVLGLFVAQNHELWLVWVAGKMFWPDPVITHRILCLPFQGEVAITVRED